MGKRVIHPGWRTHTHTAEKPPSSEMLPWQHGVAAADASVWGRPTRLRIRARLGYGGMDGWTGWDTGLGIGMVEDGRIRNWVKLRMSFGNTWCEQYEV